MPDSNEELIILPVGDPSKDAPDYRDVFETPMHAQEYLEYELPNTEEIVKSQATTEEVMEALKKALGR